MKEFFLAIAIVAVLAIVFYTPIGFIWALNTLFPSLAIPYTVKTWLASFLIVAIFGPATISTKSKN